MAEEQTAPANLETPGDMEIASGPSLIESGADGESNGKRAAEDEGVDGIPKKQKVEDTTSTEGRLEGDNRLAVRVRLGPKDFKSSAEMFYYFQKFMQFWPTDLDVNEYESTVLLDLIKKGYSEPDKKIGSGIKAFQIRNHPLFKNRCFFLIREDETVDDFSFRKCVDHILPLPDNMRIGGGNGGGGGGHRGGRGRGGGGRGRGRKFRN